MQRAATAFAIAAACLLVLGLLLQYRLAGRQAMAITFPKATHAIDYQVPCFAMAALFALFAFLYSLNLPRIGASAAQWHLWISLGSVAAFAAGFAWFGAVAPQQPAPPQSSLLCIAAGVIVAPAVFAVGQLLFLVACIRAAFR